jgi:hypothetical protein
MSLAQKPLTGLTPDDIAQLVAERCAEGITIEFKEELPGAGDSAKRDFIADVTAMANTAGGYIVYGIREEAGCAVGITGVAADDLDKVVVRLQAILDTGTDPKISGVHFRVIVVESSKQVLVVRVPRSWNGPHMLSHQGITRFYGRRVGGNFLLDTAQLQTAFQAAAMARDAAVRFRATRVLSVASGATIVVMDERPKVVLHIAPLVTVGGPATLDIEAVVRADGLRPMDTELRNPRYNLDGVALVGQGHESKTAHSYVQVFRDWCIEAVSSSLVTPHDDQLWLSSGDVEGQLIDKSTTYLEFLASAGIGGPYAVMISILGARGYQIRPASTRRYDSYRLPLPSDEVLLPDVLVESTPSDMAVLLHPTFDVLWNAAGWERCMNYRQDGSRSVQ